MPDLIAIAERLAERPPVAALDGGRCLRVRDRESSCAACAEACPVGAVAVRAAAVEEAAPYGSVDAVRDAGPRIDDEACAVSYTHLDVYKRQPCPCRNVGA